MRFPLRVAFVFFSSAAVLSLSVRAAAPAEEELPLPADELLDPKGGLAEWGAVPIFFPPDPPPLGNLGAGGSFGQWTRNRQLRPPPELAAYVGEPFYPALSTILALHDLGRWSRQRIEDYRAEKLKLSAELRMELLRVRELPTDIRREQLADFAREQTPKIAELEQTAERLREHFVKIDYRWGELRTEWLGKDRHHPDPADLVADVMRAAAYYEGGLLPAQRRFLREIALEVPLAADTVEEAVARQPYVFFSPGLARVKLPEDLPPAVARKIADYQQRRSTLKKELFDVVFERDATWLSTVRSVQFRLSLRPQAASLDRLEAQAEDIRRELARLPTARPTPRWSIPAGLVQRIGAMLEGQRALRAHSVAAIEAVRRREASLDIGYAIEPIGVEFDVQLRPRFFVGTSVEAKRHAKAVQTEIGAIAAGHRRGLGTLARERAAIRTELAQALDLSETPEIDAALAAAMREAVEQESDGPYRAYHAAVFEPGLSPEQRRLLFDSAIEQLGLSLPPGEYQPQQ